MRCSPPAPTSTTGARRAAAARHHHSRTYLAPLGGIPHHPRPPHGALTDPPHPPTLLLPSCGKQGARGAAAPRARRARVRARQGARVPGAAPAGRAALGAPAAVAGTPARRRVGRARFVGARAAPRRRRAGGAAAALGALPGRARRAARRAAHRGARARLRLCRGARPARGGRRSSDARSKQRPCSRSASGWCTPSLQTERPSWCSAPSPWQTRSRRCARL